MYDYGYNYGYDYTHQYPVTDYEAVAAVLSIIMIVVAVVLIFAVVSYIFRAVGLYTIAKRRGERYPWLAFIPFARAYLQGETAGPIILKKKTISNPGIWKLVVPIIAGAVSSIFFTIFSSIVGIGGMMAGLSTSGYGISFGVGTIMFLIVFLIIWMVVSIIYEAAYRVLCVLINMQIFGYFTTRNMAVVHAVLSAIIPLYESICFFVMRNREFNPGMEPEIAPPPARPTQAPPVEATQEPYGEAAQTTVPDQEPAEQVSVDERPVESAESGNDSENATGVQMSETDENNQEHNR